MLVESLEFVQVVTDTVLYTTETGDLVPETIKLDRCLIVVCQELFEFCNPKSLYFLDTGVCSRG